MNDLFNFKFSLTLIIFCFLFFSFTGCSSEMPRIKYNNPGLITDVGVGLWAWPLPMDYDNDGDYDLVVSCSDKPYNGIYFFENTTGDVKMPVFEPAKKIADGESNIQICYVKGKPRLLKGNKEIVNFQKHKFKKKEEIYPEENIHKNNGRIRANQWKYYDYDFDGDLDLVVGIGDWSDYGWDNAYDDKGNWTNGPLHGYIYLIKNNGTDTKPFYLRPEKIKADNKPIDVYGMPSPNMADFDEDGDLDIICGEFVDKFTYFENIGTAENPNYTDRGYLRFNDRVLKMDLCMIVPVAIDWDKDGDVDLIVGQEDGRVGLVENTGKVVEGVPQFLEPKFFQQEAKYLKFGALATPASYDWDNDGDEDLICGNTAGYIGFIENLGGFPPVWAKAKYLKANGEIIRITAGKNGSIQGPCEEKWGYTTVSIAKWDDDNLPDVIVNSIWGKVVWYKNTGTVNSPKLAAAKPVIVEWEGAAPNPEWNWWQPEGDELVTQWRTSPFVIDLNNDGLVDLVMLDHEGYLAFYERFQEAGELKLHPGKRIFYTKEAWHSDKMIPLRLNSKEAGKSGRRKICIYDWDGDGKLDLLVNSKNVNFMRNESDNSEKIVFVDKGKVHSRILAGHTTSPTIVDWDNNGLGDLLIGAEDGHFYYLENPGNN